MLTFAPFSDLHILESRSLSFLEGIVLCDSFSRSFVQD